MEGNNKVEEIEGPSRVPTQWVTQSPVPVGWMRQFKYFIEIFKEIKNIPGDVVECGLGEGNTFAMLAYLIGSENLKPIRKLWGCDSFEGWPEPSLCDASPRNPKKGEWRVSEEMVQKRLEESKINKEFPDLDIKIIKGFFGKTLPSFPKRQIAFLHIDADLYKGYRDSLKYLFPMVTKGGIVLFDEYKEFPSGPEYNGQEKWPGATKAIDDFFASSPYEIQYWQETKKYYVIKQ